MNGPYAKFLMLLSGLTAVLMGIGYGLFNYPFSEHAFNALPFIYIYFFVTTAIYHQVMIKYNEKSSQKFVNAFMATTTIKLFVSLLILLAYIFTSDNIVPFVATFATCYLVYTSFEIIVLMKHIHRSN